jgi:hypothetical protein
VSDDQDPEETTPARTEEVLETDEFELFDVDLDAAGDESKTPNPRDTLSEKELREHLDGLLELAKARERTVIPDD